MCGIVAYLGDKDAYEIIIKGLKRLEYRGFYDKALTDGGKVYESVQYLDQQVK